MFWRKGGKGGLCQFKKDHASQKSFFVEALMDTGIPSGRGPFDEYMNHSGDLARDSRMRRGGSAARILLIFAATFERFWDLTFPWDISAESLSWKKPRHYH